MAGGARRRSRKNDSRQGLGALAALVLAALIADSENRAPLLVMTPTPLDFGVQLTGTTIGQALNVENRGIAPVAVSRLIPSDGSIFRVQQGDCRDGLVPPGGRCAVSVTFSPAVAGRVTGSVQLDRNGPRAELRGEGQLPPGAAEPGTPPPDPGLIAAAPPTTPLPSPVLPPTPPPAPAETPAPAPTTTPATPLPPAPAPEPEPVPVPTSSPPAAPSPPARPLITAARFSQAPFRVRSEVDASVVGRVALTNTGETTIGSVRFRFEGGRAGGFEVREECRHMVPRSGCSVMVSFTPREAGPHAVTLVAESEGMLLDSKELIGDALEPPRLVDVPRLIGSERDDAARRLKERGLAVGTTTEAPQCESVGRVVAQNPEQHRRVPQGTAVDITVASHGPDPAVVPDVRQQSRAVAERMLRAARLSIAATSRNDVTDNAQPGSVTDVRPRPGTMLAPDCAVTLSIAVPAPKSVVPQYVGQTLAAAKQTLGTGILGGFATFRLGQVSTTDGSAIRRGEDAQLIVIEQSPQAGSQQPRGTPIDLKVRRTGGQILDGRPIERAPAPRPRDRVPEKPVIR